MTTDRDASKKRFVARGTLLRSVAKHCAIAVVVLCYAASAFAASPELAAIMPRGGQRGTEVVIEFHGERLVDAQEILAHEPGLEVVKLEPANNLVKATVKIAAGCPLGEHALRVRTATGISPVRSFWVGALPIVAEVEPNNEFAKAQAIAMNCTVHGTVAAEDVDYFRVECKKGQRLTAEVEAMRLGSAFFDAHVAILDAKRFELAASDDTPLTGQDPCCSIVVPADGAYTVRVREASYGGAAGDHYRLHVGTMPRPMAVFPAGGRPGEEIEVTFLGDPLGPVTRKIKLPTAAPANGKFALSFEDAGGIAPTPLPFRLVDLPGAIEVEPNDAATQATPAPPAPCALHGIIAKPKDTDTFKVALKKNGIYDVRVFARKLGSPLDPVLIICNAAGQPLVGNDDAEASPDSYLRFVAPEDKDYLISVRDHLGQGGPLFHYRVEVAPIKARVETTLQRTVDPPSQERLTVTVPKGNRMATMVNLRRIDCVGDVALSFLGLPDKLTAQSDPAPNAQAIMPVLFEAAADAPTAGKLVELRAKLGEADSRFEQFVPLVVANNQQYYHVYRPDRVAVAVAEAAPFTLKIIEPKAPLTRSGSMLLKVVAERKPDFKAAIRVGPLYHPPGLSAPGEVVIPEGQNEVLLAVTANGAAALGKWKYIVLGTADVGGPMRVSSQMATIEVAAPFVQLALDRASVEQGKSATLHGKVVVATPFTGPAKVKLIGLPPKLTVNDVEITSESKEISFTVTAEAAATPGAVKNLFCQVSLAQAGEPVVHSAGGTELRVDAPLPSKPAAAPAAKPTTAQSPPPKPADKPLTRLEQLRKDQENKGKP